jgi:hypothetical protein
MEISGREDRKVVPAVQAGDYNPLELIVDGVTNDLLIGVYYHWGIVASSPEL